MSATETPEKPVGSQYPRISRGSENDVDFADGENERIIVAQIDSYIDQCRSLYSSPLINERTRNEYEHMWNELRDGREVEHMRDNVRLLSKTVSEAKNYASHFHAQLDLAVDNKWIGKKTMQNWLDRFEDENVLEWTRKKWIMDEFPKYMKGWKEVANERKDVRALAKKLGMTDEDIPELKGIYKIQDFLSLHFSERKNKVHAAKAALLAHEKKETKFYEQVRGELAGAVRKGWLHESKVGERLKRMMESDDPETYRKEVLLDYMAIWERDANEYDELHEEMKSNVTPRGLRVLDKNGFLLLTYEQRVSYLREVRLRMKTKVETDPALDAYKKKIRHNLDTQDWDGARDVLKGAQQTYSDDEDLLSMEEFLREYGGKTKDTMEAQTGPDMQKRIEEMRSIVGQLPRDLQWLYIQAMMGGTEEYDRLAQIFYNRVWVYEHGYSDEERDRKEAKSAYNKEKTREYIEEGHSRLFERNIIEGDTADGSAIRDECRKPQVLYMGDTGREAVLRKVRANKDNESFGYWTTLVPNDVPYALHRTIVKNFNYPLKSGLRELHKQGYRFTMSGPLVRTDGSIAPTKQNAA